MKLVPCIKMSSIPDQVATMDIMGILTVQLILPHTLHPPPSIKARIPNYPHEKLRLMGKLMDDMETMGVLQTPESAGVVPTFVVPSMLRPKSEPGQWRCVRDEFIKKKREKE